MHFKGVFMTFYRIFLAFICLLLLTTGSIFAALKNPKPSEKINSHYPFVVFSPPKCGTHLVGKAVSLLVKTPPAYYLSDIGNSTLECINKITQEQSQGRFVAAHHFSNALLKILVKKGYKIIFVVRDPRDQLISIVNWFREGQWSWLPASKISNVQDQITELITGATLGWKSVDTCFLSFENKLSGISPRSIYITHFEKLIGPSGGGTAEAQTQEMINIANFLGTTINTEDINFIGTELYGGTATFRNGSIGKWKQCFNGTHKEQFKQGYNSLLIRLGYEHDANW